MSLIINNNMMAANAARTLSQTYGKLSTSVQRMASGLRINSAADDAAGLAIRELMRADIATTRQGIRNAADAISLIQTADGALAIIDEKLTRMKELAEQAATGTYTTVQRDMINSEYQAMAAEIDRIANATNFNGVKLLDGSITNQHGGQGMKIHFGVSNKEAEDYYFINMGDARATSRTGLKVGGDAKNDIWGQGAAASGALSGPGCCTAGFTSLNSNAGFNSGQSFSFGYNWDWQEEDDKALLTGKYLAGRYTVGSSDSLQDLVDKVNLGTQSRVGIKMSADVIQRTVESGGTLAVCIGNETYGFGDEEVLRGQTMQRVPAAYNGMSAIGYRTVTSGSSTFTFATSSRADFKSAGINLKAIGTITQPGTGKTSAEAKSAAVLAVNSAISALVTSWGDGIPANVEHIDLTAATGTGATTPDITAANVSATAASHGHMNGAGTHLAQNTTTEFATGLYVDSNGNFTTDETLAKALGFTEVKATVTTKQGTEEISAITIDGRKYVPGATTASTATLTAAEITTQVQAHVDYLQTKSTAIGNTGMGEVTRAGAGTFTTNAAATSTNVTYGLATEYQEGAVVDHTKNITMVTQYSSGVTYTQRDFDARILASAINNNPDSEFWAMVQGDDMLYVFHKDGGNNNDIKACEAAGHDAISREGLNGVSFEHVESGTWHDSGTSLSLGGEFWGTMKPVQTKIDRGNEVWNLTLNGRDVGKDRDLWITNPGELDLPGLDESIIPSMDRDSFMEIQNAADGNWKGAEVRTQSSAQEALDAINEAITNKDKIRADLGAMQNRLENTMTNLEIQAENLQASESRISDVDVAKEMTEFTKNNVLVQAGVSMLAQANSMSQLALSLLG